MSANKHRILVTGGSTFLGDNIAAALLAEGADVTLLVRPEAKANLGLLTQRVRLATADVWDTASLRGHARGHALVIHTVGSMLADPARGLTFQRMNLVSARNVATMCISDGVPEMLLLSSTRTPWTKRAYIRSKREAEQYIGRVGIRSTIIRAPLVYQRGASRPLFFRLMTLLGSTPPLSWFFFGRVAPMPVDLLARGIARIALEPAHDKTIYYAPDLRRRNRREERSMPVAPAAMSPDKDDTQPRRPAESFGLVDEETPFGWTPPPDTRQE
jgi:uncharacterized protein YbjT (DUF2867 family)